MLGTLDYHALLSQSAQVEQAFAVAVPVILALLWIATRQRPPVAPVTDDGGTPITPAEIGLVLLVLAGAVLLRVAWWDRGLPGTIFGGEIVTARAALAAERGGLLARWWSLVRQPNGGGWWYDSPVVEPVVVAFQWLFSPEIHGIVRVGAAFGAAGVLLAWLAGRLLHGPRFGLAFAAFVAVSPLQVVWSRLGYRAMAVTPHVLLAIALAVLSARRRSLVLAALAGVVAYTTVYNHEVARAAIPLAIVALWCATRTPGPSALRFVGLAVVVTLVILVLAARLPKTGGGRDMLWPTYRGYVGNQGESTLKELVAKNYVRIAGETSHSVVDYFVVNRNNPPTPSVWGWGIAYGGLAFLPVTALGAFGLVHTLRAPSRHLLWYAMLGVGLAMPAMACTAARRLLVFDLGWCAFAAAGLVALAGTPLLGRVPRRARGLLAGALVAALGCWTMAAIVTLARGPGDGSVSNVAFAGGWMSCSELNSRVSDVTTCPHCVDVATGWNRDIRAGALVVLVDSDMNRENPTAPAGLPLYGFLAAARNDAAERFETLYPLLMNVNHVPEARRYYPRSGDYAAYFADLLRRVAHRSIVWHSERPTAWDRWLGRRLGELGGTTSTFATPLSAGGGFRVETPPSADEAVIRLLASLEKPPPIDPRPCVSPRVVSRQQLPFQANALAPVDIPTDDVPATWFALSWNDVWSAHGGWHLPAIRHVAGGPREIGTLRADGIGERLSWPTRASLRTERLVDLLPIGWGCATVAGGEWWVVDPERGTLHSHASHEWLPPGEWIGVTSDRADELILAAADQRIVVADIRTRAVRAEFPAAIMPSRLESFGECSQIVRGRDWIGVYRAPGAAVDFYTPDGRPSGTLDLESNGFTFIRAVSAADTFLAVTDGLEWLTTLRIDVKPCASP